MGSPAGLATVVDPRNFKVPKHVEFLNRKIVETATTPMAGLLVLMPPQHGKSSVSSRWAPPWYLGRYPNRRVLLITYAEGYAKDYGGFARNVLEYAGETLYGVKVAEGSAAKNQWRIQGSFNGGMDAQGYKGQITGKPGDLIIMDDLVKNHTEAQSEVNRLSVWDAYQSVITTRRSDVASQIILMTHWHRQDIAGKIMDMIAGSPKVAKRWQVIRLPALAHEDDPLGRAPGEALWPERYSKEYLEEVRDSISPYWWSALYDTYPIAGEAMEWPNEYFDHAKFWAKEGEWPSKRDDVLRVIALDPSKGRVARSDFSAFVMLTIARNGMAFVDSIMERMPSEEIIRRGAKLMAEFDPDVFVLEGNAWQDMLMEPMLTEMTNLGVQRPQERFKIVEHFGGSTGSKVERIRASSIGERLKGHWIKFRKNRDTKILVEQLREFPVAVHDDGPDALEMALDEVGQVLDGSGRRERVMGVVR